MRERREMRPQARQTRLRARHIYIIASLAVWLLFLPATIPLQAAIFIVPAILPQMEEDDIPCVLCV